MPLAKTYPFARSKQPTQAELEDVYKYLQKQLDELNVAVTALQTTSSTAPVDYSYQIQMLNTAVTTLQAQVAALEAQLAALNLLQFEFGDNNDTLLITTPAGVRQVILAIYP